MKFLVIQNNTENYSTMSIGYAKKIYSPDLRELKVKLVCLQKSCVQKACFFCGDAIYKVSA